MKGRHFTITKKVKKRTKSIVLSIVALLELLLVVTSVTFSWFEGLTSFEIKGEQFKTADILNSHAEIGENDSATDTTYSEAIDLTTFFDAQKEVRLSPVSSADAVNFYAPYEGQPGKTGTKYRKLTQADINSNIIQFEFEISAPDGNTDFYLTQDLPIVNIDGFEYTYKDRDTCPFRFAFSDGTNTVILKNTANLDDLAVKSLNADDTAVTESGTLSCAQEYAYYDDHREKVEILDYDGFPVDERPIKPLFHLDKNETKKITVAVWLEAYDYDCVNNTSYMVSAGTPISFNIKLCSSWSIKREITAFDYTATQWIDNKDDGNRNTYLYVRNADGDDNNRQYKLDYTADQHGWRGFIPIALDNCEFLWGTEKNGKCNPDETWGKFQAPNRGNAEIITMLGDKSACVWGLDPADLVKIDFRDYTDASWIINKDDTGVEIAYDGRILDYSMTDTPTTDQYGKNSWSCWIPNTVNQVDFSRRGFKSANNYVEFNRWYGTDRNGETVYRATGGNGGTTGGGSTSSGPFTLYVKIDDAIASTIAGTSNGESPAISFTNNANITVWDKTLDKTEFNRTEYKPLLDDWNVGATHLTKSNDEPNTWFITFAEKPDPGTHVTVWSRNVNNYNDVDVNTSFGVFYLFEDGKNYNTITITTAQKLTNSNATNNYALLGTMSGDGSGAGGNVNPEGDVGTGVWGELDPPPNGTYDSTFIHVSDVDSVKVTFTYENTEWTMEMTKDTGDSTGRTWITRAMPNSGVTNIKFTDSNGKVWTDPGTATRNTLRKYFYAKDTNGNSTGWRNKVSTTSSSGTTYVFKHYNTATTSLTVSYTTSVGVPFTFNLEKGSDNKSWSTSNIPDDATSVKYSDGTRTWSITDFDSSTPYCYALDNNQYQLKKTANYARIYLERNYTWTDMKIYHTGTDAPQWRGNSMIDLGRTYSSSPLYCYLVPTDAGLIIFNGIEDGSTKQTVDITSYHTTDMRKFKFSSWNSTQNKANCSSTTLSASSLN